MTLLSIVQDASVMLSLPRPTSLSGAPTPLALALVQIANLGGKNLSRAHDWQALTYTKTFNPVADVAQIGNPPANFDRFSPQQEIWDVGRQHKLIGPLDSKQWAALMTGYTPTWPYYWTRQQGSLQIWPAPMVTDVFRYQYVSRNWVRPDGAYTDGSQDTARWVDGTDTALLNEDLLLLDLIWRFKQFKGLDYAEDMATFEREKEQVIARDRGPKIIDTAPPDFHDPYSDDAGYTWPGQVVA